MLDYDFICKRKTPSVAAVIYPFGGQFILKQYWGTKETLLPVYQSTAEVCYMHILFIFSIYAHSILNLCTFYSYFQFMHILFIFSIYANKQAIAKHPDADVVVNFASSRSAYSSTMELLKFPQIRVCF